MTSGSKGKSTKQSKKPKAQAKKKERSFSPLVKAPPNCDRRTTDAQISADLEEIRTQVHADPDYAEHKRHRDGPFPERAF